MKGQLKYKSAGFRISLVEQLISVYPLIVLHATDVVFIFSTRLCDNVSQMCSSIKCSEGFRQHSALGITKVLT